MRFDFAGALFRSALVLGFLALFPSLARAAAAQWSTTDIRLSSKENYSNGYSAGPTLSATFSCPEQAPVTISGFWTGNNKFIIRFTPTAQGTWSYTTRSSDASLSGKSGTLNAKAPVAGNHGFLRIDPTSYTTNPSASRTSFVWGDGTRYYMVGQTYYDIMRHAMANDTWKKAITNSQAHGMNKVRIFVYEPGYSNPLYPGNVQGYAGTRTNPDRDTLDLAYWNKFDQVVQFLNEKGMVADLILTSPYFNNNQYGTAAQNDRFLKYAVARYGAYTNVIWNLCNEWEKSQTTATAGGTGVIQHKADYERMGRLVHDTDPYLASGTYLRPLSIHSVGPTAVFPFFPPASMWSTHAIIQGARWGIPESVPGDQWGNESITHNLGHNMPVVNDEYGYIGDAKYPQVMLRQCIWGIAAAGGYGSADEEDYADWSDKHVAEYNDIKHLTDFFTTRGIEYWKMSANNALLRDVSAGARTYLLAEPGRQYVAYAATGGSFSLQLPPGTYWEYRYDPATGVTTNLGFVSGGVVRTFIMPAARADGSSDCVLHLATFEE